MSHFDIKKWDLDMFRITFLSYSEHVILADYKYWYCFRIRRSNAVKYKMQINFA